MGTPTVNLSIYDLPFLAILGLLSGILGAMFGRGIFASLAFFRGLKGLGLPGRIGLAGLITGIVGIFLPIAAADNTGLQEFLVTGSVGWQLVAIAFVTKFLLTLLAYGFRGGGGNLCPLSGAGGSPGVPGQLFSPGGLHRVWLLACAGNAGGHNHLCPHRHGGLF